MNTQQSITRVALAKSRCAAAATLFVAIIVTIALVASSAQSQTFAQLYSFSGTDGANPSAGLILDNNGYIYGTTLNGGAAGYGEVFEMDPSTSYLAALYTFSGDLAGPVSKLVLNGANIYGTTAAGEADDCMGVGGCGAVFDLTPSYQPCNPPGFCTWYYNVLHSFSGGANGSDPYGDLIFDQAGNIFGTTRYGGGAGQCGGNPSTGCGTVYKLIPGGPRNWPYTKIYSFGTGNDGKEPTSGLFLDSQGNLWGTTLGGGLNIDNGQNKGTVFATTPSGTESCLISFDDGSFGGYSFAGLTYYASNLYGANADAGGVPNNAGRFFEVGITNCSFTPLQGFQELGVKLDLQGPRAKLITDGGGNFYGITTTGGLYGYGSVFKVTQSSAPQTLYSFCSAGLPTSCTDGAYPTGELVLNSNGTVLYGTTYSGGNFPAACPQGCGTIFKLTL